MASTRLRCLRPAKLLSGAGIDSKVFRRYEPRRSDVVVFQKAYEPEHLVLAKQLRRQGVRLILDVCDNHFYNPSGSKRLAERAERLQRMVDLVDVVTVSTPALAQLVEHDRLVLVDDCVDWPQRRRMPRPRSGQIRLLWFGSAGDPTLGFGLCDLGARMAELSSFAAGRSVELVVVSNSAEQFRRWVGSQPFSVRYVPWDRRRFPGLLTMSDVVVLPVTRNPFTTAKTSNRPVSALIHGVPVVTSPLPSYLELSRYMLFEDWQDHLARYADDPWLAATHVRNAAGFITERFSDARIMSQWWEAVDS